MPIRKIGEAPRVCLDLQHNPPSHMYLEPGTYEYTCPSCGHKVVFTVPVVTA